MNTLEHRHAEKLETNDHDRHQVNNTTIHLQSRQVPLLEY